MKIAIIGRTEVLYDTIGLLLEGGHTITCIITNKEAPEYTKTSADYESHGGDLPRYRGNACQAWAILNGEDRIGLCIHRMIGDELDSGDIIARDYFSIDQTTKVTKAWEWLHKKIPELFLEA